MRPSVPSGSLTWKGSPVADGQEPAQEAATAPEEHLVYAALGPSQLTALRHLLVAFEQGEREPDLSTLKVERLSIAEAVRAAFPDEPPMFYRLQVLTKPGPRRRAFSSDDL